VAAGACNDKPAGCFTSTATLHGGQEVSNYTMWPALAHLGFLIVGVCYATPELMTPPPAAALWPQPRSRRHVGHPVDDTEKAICGALGERVARLADLLKQ